MSTYLLMEYATYHGGEGKPSIFEMDNIVTIHDGTILYSTKVIGRSNLFCMFIYHPFLFKTIASLLSNQLITIQI